MGSGAALKLEGAKIPKIFGYHDYRQFLKDWLEFMKSESKLSLRGFAERAEISPAYLSMILSGTRNLSIESLSKMAQAIPLDGTEESYFRLLLSICDSESQEKRLSALDKLQKHGAYKNANPKEIEAYRYLTNWYYVAIREMAALPGFKMDPVWIQSQLRYPIPTAEISKALKFLVDFGFIEVIGDGSVRLPEKQVECFGGVYKIALAQFYKEMFQLASQSIDRTPRPQRSLAFHTLAISRKHFHTVKKILDDAMEKVVNLGAIEKNPEAVYHVSFASFPLTDVRGEPDEDV